MLDMTAAPALPAGSRAPGIVQSDDRLFLIDHVLEDEAG
jgi:hypothetical protein